MGIGQIPLDGNNKPLLAGYDATGHQVVVFEIVSTATDSTTGVVHGAINMSTTTGAAVALSSPPTNTNAGSDTQLTFTQQARHFLIQNNSAANVYVNLDATASTGSIVLVPGGIWRDDIPVTSPHLYTAAAQPINAANGIVVKGWS